MYRKGLIKIYKNTYNSLARRLRHTKIVCSELNKIIKRRVTKYQVNLLSLIRILHEAFINCNMYLRIFDANLK